MDGIINIYKEKGWTSFDVVAKLRGILKEKRIGHTGTLDPEAEGVLVVCVGRATRLVNSITGTDKVYEAGIRLGIETDTEDTTGQVLAERPVTVDEAAFRAAVRSFVGEIEQVPPMYSAKKVDGKKLYEYARAGKVIARAANKVTIHSITVDAVDFPDARMTVTCGKGTYIRTLCADIGRKLGCGAAMSALKRTRVGRFCVEGSVKLADLEQAAAEGRLAQYVKPAVCITEPVAATFGKFDGGHTGHQLIFQKLREVAAARGLKTAVLTFSVNPQALLSGEQKNSISTSEEHISRLKNMGFDYVVEFPMTADTARMTAETFLKEILVDGMNARALVVGTDCAFGYQKGGDAAFLKAHEAEYGYETFVLEKKQFTDEQGARREISSTCIKEELVAGNAAMAAELLGRYFAISGTVVHGKKIGSTVLGFPTANIFPTKSKTVPKEGVYATRVLIDGKLYLGMTNIGTNPTVCEGNPVNIETYVLDYAGDLYGKKIRVEFVDRIRDQVKFASLEELKAQLREDVKTAAGYRRVLS